MCWHFACLHFFLLKLQFPHIIGHQTDTPARLLKFDSIFFFVFVVALFFITVLCCSYVLSLSPSHLIVFSVSPLSCPGFFILPIISPFLQNFSPPPHVCLENTSWGFFRAKLSSADSFCRLGRQKSTTSQGHLNRWWD